MIKYNAKCYKSCRETFAARLENEMILLRPHRSEPPRGLVSRFFV
jgi:hypothetical protein